MRAITKVLTATAAVAALAFAAAPSQAALFISFNGVTDAHTTTDGAYAFIDSVGGFETLVTAGFTGFYPDLLHSSQVEFNATGNASLTMWVTHTDIDHDLPESVLSKLTGNVGGTGTWSVNLSTYIDPLNGKYGGNLLSSANFSSPLAVAFNEIRPTGLSGSGPFSVTHKYVVSVVGGGSSSPTAVMTAVPEPGTWALMIMGFGGAGAMLRSRRRALAVAA